MGGGIACARTGDTVFYDALTTPSLDFTLMAINPQTTWRELLLSGGVVLAGLIGLVGVATVAVLGVGTGETLSSVQATDVESLSTIAGRIAASLS
jgi:hypothetical protein